MNYRMISQILGKVLLIESALLLLPLVTAIVYGESVLPFAVTIAATCAAGSLLLIKKPKRNDIYAREGFVVVGLSWILMSLFGCLPFILSGDIPNFVDAFFETVSGFTTTGASILTNVEGLCRSCQFWRLFTHWVGGMGVLVFIMAILPMSGDHSMHIMRAEVPGPTVGKLVPRVKKTAMILYLIYIALTVIEFVFLLFGGLSFYDALLHSFATAGTGGFSTYADSIAHFGSAYVEIVVAVFMLLFGINFNLYFLALIGNIKAALKNEELHWYLIIVVFAVLTIAINIVSLYGSFAEAMRYSFFQVGTIISSTGFSTADFNQWPDYSRFLLLTLMFVGACAGSTGGGMKLSRIMIIVKSAGCEIKNLIRPRSVNHVMLDGKLVSRDTVRLATSYFVVYMFITFCATLLLSFDELGFTTTFTAVVSCMSNMGPGLDLVGSAGNYSIFSDASKLILSACMLLGRLEIYPVLLLAAPSTWKKR